MPIKQTISGIDNFTYIIFCEKTNTAAIVDPSFNPKNALDFIDSRNLKLKYMINTHYHSDHSASNKKIKEIYSSVKLISSKIDSEHIDSDVDIHIKHNDILKIGEVSSKFLLTPGHTKGSICIIVDGKAILTGDTLFIGNCGRTDLSGGSLDDMFNSLNSIIKPLPDELIVYPGHDYGAKPFDTLGNQKKTNPTLIADNIKDFSKIP